MNTHLLATLSDLKSCLECKKTRWISSTPVTTTLKALAANFAAANICNKSQHTCWSWLFSSHPFPKSFLQKHSFHITIPPLKSTSKEKKKCNFHARKKYRKVFLFLFIFFFIRYWWTEYPMW